MVGGFSRNRLLCDCEASKSQSIPVLAAGSSFLCPDRPRSSQTVATLCSQKLNHPNSPTPQVRQRLLRLHCNRQALSRHHPRPGSRSSSSARTDLVARKPPQLYVAIRSTIQSAQRLKFGNVLCSYITIATFAHNTTHVLAADLYGFTPEAI